MRSTIICVDDEKVLLNVLSDQLESWFGSNYNIEKALSGEEALEIVDECIKRGQDISVVISDYIMPKMKGDELLEQIKDRDPKIKKIMLTGYSSIDGIVRAINRAGLYRYITKPWDNKDLMLTLLEAIKSYESEKKSIELSKSFESLYHKYEKLYIDYEQSFESSLELLAQATDLRTFDVPGHSMRVSKFAAIIAKAVGISEENIEIIKHCALLHDVGKISMTDEEIKEITQNKNQNLSCLGLRIKQINATEKVLKSIKNSDKFLNIIKHQYEEYAGSGPLKVKGENIPIGSRILAIANQFDFYKSKTNNKMTLDEIVEHFEDEKGILYDPACIKIFIDIIKPKITK